MGTKPGGILYLQSFLGGEVNGKTMRAAGNRRLSSFFVALFQLPPVIPVVDHEPRHTAVDTYILSGNEANTFYNDAHSLEGECDYVMANPPFNVDKVKSESAMNAGRLPFGVPSINAAKEFGNGNYLWISYFYAYLNDHGRAGFVMASSATDSANKDRDIREKLVRTGDVDVMVSVGNNFFYTLSLPCSLWFFDRAKRPENRDKVLFIDEGQILESGTPEEFFGNPKNPRLKEFLSKVL